MPFPTDIPIIILFFQIHIFKKDSSLLCGDYTETRESSFGFPQSSYH